MNSPCMEVIKEEKVVYQGRGEYIKITYADGRKILKQYNEKYKTWVILKFKDENFDDSQIIKDFIETVKFLMCRC